jgi:hypothetical protein
MAAAGSALRLHLCMLMGVDVKMSSSFPLSIIMAACLKFPQFSKKRN